MPSSLIPFSRPSLNNKEILAVTRVLKKGWLTGGQETITFEKEFAQYLRSHPSERGKNPIHAISVASCSAGLHLAIKALNIPKSKKVLVNSYTFVSDASAVLHAGNEFEFYDISPTSLYPDVEIFKKKVSQSSYGAVIFVHITGFIPEQYQELIAIAKHYKLAIIEDAAHSFPAYNNEGFLGTMGDIAVYSFYANKTITTGEGGMIVSRNPNLIDIMTLLRNNGINKSTWQRHKNNIALYDVEDLGFKYNLSDIQSAIGRVQLQKAAKLQEKRKNLVKEYLHLLKNCPFVLLPEMPTQEQSHSWHIFCIQWKHPSISRDMLVQALKQQNIHSSIHYRPLHTMTYYKKRYALKNNDFPNAFFRFSNTISLPLFADMKLQDVRRVSKTIIHIGENIK